MVKVRKGVALLLVAGVLLGLGALLGNAGSATVWRANLGAGLVLVSYLVAAVGLGMVIVGLWRGDPAKGSDR